MNRTTWALEEQATQDLGTTIRYILMFLALLAIDRHLRRQQNQ
jgi:hypothetical protein